MKYLRNISLVASAGITLSFSSNALSDCTDNNGQITCSNSTSGTYSATYYQDTGINISGTWTKSGHGNAILAIPQYGNSTVINVDAEISWTDAALGTTSPSSAWAAVGAGWDAHLNVGKYANLNISKNSIIDIYFSPQGISPNGGTIVATGLVNSGSTTGGLSNVTNNGHIRVSDNRLVNETGYTVGIYNYAINSDSEIFNHGQVELFGDSGSGTRYEGITIASINNLQNQKTSANITNTGRILVQDQGNNPAQSHGVIFYVLKNHTDATLNNYGSIKSIESNNNSYATGVFFKSFQTWNKIDINNSQNASITASSSNNENAYSIYLEGFTKLNLNNQGTLTGKIATSEVTSSPTDASDSIINTGSIIGNVLTYAGDDYFQFLDGLVTGTIDAGDGNDHAIWSGGSLNTYSAGLGSDSFLINGKANYKPGTLIDGGDDLSIADGMIDTLTFSGINLEIQGADFSNWENIEIIQSQISVTDAKISASADQGYGFTIKSGGALYAGINLVVDGNISIDSSSKFAMQQTSATPNHTIINGNVENSGIIALNGKTNTDTLTINGDYSGLNGTLEINTELNGDQSLSDKLIVNGSASGRTRLIVKNFFGVGSSTTQGIQVISTTNSTADAFYLPGGYVSAGQFEYSLSMLNENNQDNWYLSNSYNPEDHNTPIYSPNPGSIIGIQQASNSLFSHRLEDREGASQKLLLTKDNMNFWMRTFGQKNRFNSFSSQLETNENSWGTQLGVGFVDLGEDEQLNLGLMAAYGGHHNKTESRITHRKASGESTGYSIGGYMTWYQDFSKSHGSYIDTWLTWNTFDNTLKTADGYSQKFKSKGITASFETGTHYLISESEKSSWWIQPQIQIQYQGVSADSFRDEMGVQIKSGKDNIQTRFGAKSYVVVPVAINSHKNYRPYLELNWLNNSHPHSVVINNESHSAQGSRNLGEFKVGLEGDFSEQGQIWANASYLAGSHGNRTLQGTLGLKYNF